MMPPVFGSIEKASKFLKEFGLYRVEVYRGRELMGFQPPGKWIARVGHEVGFGDTARRAFDHALALWQMGRPDEYAKAVAEWEARQLGTATPQTTVPPDPGGRL